MTASDTPGLVQTLSFRAEDRVVDEVRGAVFAIEKADPSFSREVLLRRAVQLALEELRALHNNGRRFRPVKKLRTGQRRRGED